MRSFREEYQKEMDRQGTFHLDAERVSDEIHHHKLKKAHRRRAMASVASAAAVFLLLGGVATAMNYGSSFIQVRHNGFSITGPQQADAGGEAGTSVPGPAKERSRQRSEEAEPECVAYQMEVKEYDSLSAFKEDTDISVPLPDLELLGGEAADQSVHIVGDQVYIRIQEEQDRMFSVMQMDHRGSQGYAASSVYSGEAANERNYTTSQGYTYKVIDLMEDGEVSSIECAISLYGRDLLVGFWGYTQEEAYTVLQTMDLDVYTLFE